MDQPNILLIIADQHRPDFIGTNEKIPIRTPNIDRLGERGVRFGNAFCPSPLCAPARASLASGKAYDRITVRNNDVNFPADETTFYQLLRDSGYHTISVGKVDLAKAGFDWGLDGKNHLDEWGFVTGINSEGKFDAIIASVGVRPPALELPVGEYPDKQQEVLSPPPASPGGPYTTFLNERKLLDAHVADLWNRHPYADTYPTPLPDDAYNDNWVPGLGLRFLKEAPSAQPWFLQVNFSGPHDPMDVTERMRDRWDDVSFPLPVNNTQFDRQTHDRIRQNYAAMVENIDRHVGTFLDYLNETGQLDNTLVIYTSDHGEMLGDHNLWRKSVHYRSSTGIPMVIAGPGVRQGAVTEALVSFHDLAATALDCAGLEVPAEMDSRSLRPILEGLATGHRATMVSALMEWAMVTDGRYKLVRFQDGRTEVYDWEDDPQELHDIAAENEEIVARLEKSLPEAYRRPVADAPDNKG